MYTVKISPNRKVDHLKAWLVAKGCAWILGQDFGVTFSMVAKIALVRLLLFLTTTHHWTMHQLDIKNVFLHKDVKEDVDMEQPFGFVAQGVYSRKVCKLKKSLYGLKQSLWA